MSTKAPASLTEHQQVAVKTGEAMAKTHLLVLTADKERRCKWCGLTETQINAG